MFKKLTSSVVLFAALLIAACGEEVKVQDKPVVTPPELQKGEVFSEKKIYIVKPSTDHVHPGKERFITYTILSAADRSQVGENITVEAKYGMPSMPMMKITPATVSRLEDGRYEVKFEFQHGGDWEITLNIGTSEQVIDTAVFKLDIHEESQHEHQHGDGDDDDHDHGDGDHDHGDHHDDDSNPDVPNVDPAA